MLGDFVHGPVPLALLGRSLEHEPDGALAGGTLLCHDSIFLQAMESPPKSGRFTQGCRHASSHDGEATCTQQLIRLRFFGGTHGGKAPSDYLVSNQHVDAPTAQGCPHRMGLLISGGHRYHRRDRA
jgi:hypothetical protein